MAKKSQGKEGWTSGRALNIGRRPRLLEAAAGSPMGRGRRRGHGAAQQQRKQFQAKPHLDAFLYFPLQPKFQELAWFTQFPPSLEASLKLRRKLLFTWSSVRVIHLQASWKSPHRTPGWMGQQREAGYPSRLSIQAKDRQSQQQGQGHSVTWIVFADSHSESQFYWFLSPVFFKFASTFHPIVSSMDPQYLLPKYYFFPLSLQNMVKSLKINHDPSNSQR